MLIFVKRRKILYFIALIDSYKYTVKETSNDFKPL